MSKKLLFNFNREVIQNYTYVKYVGAIITATNTLEKPIKSAILKGQTLVNLVPSYTIDYTATSNWDGYYQLVQNSRQSSDQWRALQDLKPNTKYYISCYVETFSDTNGRRYALNNSNDNCIFEEFMYINSVGHFNWVLTSRNEFTDMVYVALRCQNEYSKGAIKIRDIMIIEYQEGMENWDIPYFEGMQSVKMPVLKTTGKNLFDVSKATYGYISSDGSINNAKNNVKSDFILVKGNTSYSVNAADSAVINSCFSWFDNNKIFISRTFGQTQISPSNAKYLIVHNNYFPTSVDTNDLTTVKLMITEGYTLENYEPYKSNILTVNEVVELRRIGNMQDELDLLTGELTQRIGEVVLDGTGDWQGFMLDTTNNKATARLHLPDSDSIVYNISSDVLVSDKLKTSYWKVNKLEVNSVFRWDSPLPVIGITLSLDNDVNTFDKFKSFLSQNPVKVYYQRITPPVKTVDLSILDQNENKVSSISSFNDTTHITASSEIIPPIFEGYLATKEVE